MMYKQYLIIALSFTIPLISNCGGSDGGGSSTPQTDLVALKIDLGSKIFNDTNLSKNGNQSCATCHDASAGFANNSTHNSVSNTSPVSMGSDSGIFGDRNAPTAAYASFIPTFRLDSTDGYIGGQFVDGRATTLVEQAKGPFLNPKEMANTDKADVISKITNSTYSGQFEDVYGSGSLSDIEAAYDQVADAIAAFESTDTFSPFTSKFDAVEAGTATYTDAELRGFNLFEDENKTRCIICHTLETTNTANKALFTNFIYSNIGTPINPNNPEYISDTSFRDLGLGGPGNTNLTTSSAAEEGKFRVPTLRNVEITAPYMHNGVFKTLDDVMLFYNESQVFDRECPNTSDLITDPIVCWPQPEVMQNREENDVGDLSLNQNEMNDLVAFMKTLTDGYTP
jgi:cytochrome c peroxidase